MSNPQKMISNFWQMKKLPINCKTEFDMWLQLKRQKIEEMAKIGKGDYSFHLYFTYLDSTP